MANIDVNFTWDYQGWFAELARQGRPMSARAKNLLLTQSNRQAVKFWHRVFIPRHFESGNAQRYRYKARKRPYRRIKEALAAGRTFDPSDGVGETINDRVIKGGTVSMVRSGDSEQKSKRQNAVFSTPNKATARVSVPGYISRRSRSNRPDQRRELQTLTQAEKRQLNQVWAKNFFRGVRQLGTAAFRVRRTT